MFKSEPGDLDRAFWTYIGLIFLSPLLGLGFWNFGVLVVGLVWIAVIGVACLAVFLVVFCGIAKMVEVAKASTRRPAEQSTTLRDEDEEGDFYAVYGRPMLEEEKEPWAAILKQKRRER